MKNISSNAPIATGAITRPPNRIALNNTESRDSTPGSNQIRNASSSSNTATRSSTRSTTIVANAAVALSPSRRASRYGRITSPARAGSTADAAKPITVVRNTVRKRVGPSGSSKYCQRSARITNVRTVSADRQPDQIRSRCRHRRPHPSQIGFPKKDGKQANGKTDDHHRPDDVAQTAFHTT